MRTGDGVSKAGLDNEELRYGSAQLCGESEVDAVHIFWSDRMLYELAGQQSRER